MTTIDWQCQSFEELSTTSLYALLKLRAEVFVVEQSCAYLDPDGLDPQAFHWLAWQGDELVACQRCLAPGTSHAAQSSLGRIVVARAARGEELGRELVRRGIDFNRRQWPGYPLRIGAQCYLTRFYESFGFRLCGAPYLEDGIEHVAMQLEA